MLYSWINGIKRAPIKKGEKTTCHDCGGILTSVIPVEKIKHWRHKTGDCDNWSEPEGQWHLSWKEQFELNNREVSLLDEISGERHRADILCNPETPESVVLELQHSSISEEDQVKRESFYTQNSKMFWLVHIHSEKSFNEFAFESALNFSKEVQYAGRRFIVANWVGRSFQFIEKWKKSNVHVFFDYKDQIFYLANTQISNKLGGPFERGKFAVCSLSKIEFINTVKGLKTKHLITSCPQNTF